MYKLIQESAEIEQGLYADVLQDECGEVVLVIDMYDRPLVYMVYLSDLVVLAGKKYDAQVMWEESIKTFDSNDDYCKWFNWNVTS